MDVHPSTGTREGDALNGFPVPLDVVVNTGKWPLVGFSVDKRDEFLGHLTTLFAAQNMA